MNIAFFEYKMDLTSGGDVNFMVCWASLLRDFGHQIDLVQFKKESKYALKYGFQVKHVDDVKIDHYDIVIINNIYIHGDAATREFIDFIYKIQTTTLYMNHDRPNLSNLFKNAHVWELLNMCDCTIGYYGNIFRNLIDPKRVFDIGFHHFYKPFEDGHPEIVLDRSQELIFLARMSRIKGMFRFMDYTGFHHGKSPDDFLALYGYFGSIGQVELKTDPRMILEISEKKYKLNPHFNSESSYLHLRDKIASRQEIVDTLKSSKFSWNAYSFLENGKKIYDVIDNGLEAGPLESILYGCVPIIHDISRTIKITDSSKFEDYDCSIFVNDEMSFDEIYDLIKEEERTGTKRKNLVEFSRMILDKQSFHDELISTFMKIKSIDSNRKYIQFDIPLSEVTDKGRLIEASKIRGAIVKNPMKQDSFDFEI